MLVAVTHSTEDAPRRLCGLSWPSGHRVSSPVAAALSDADSASAAVCGTRSVHHRNSTPLNDGSVVFEIHAVEDGCNGEVADLFGKAGVLVMSKVGMYAV